MSSSQEPLRLKGKGKVPKIVVDGSTMDLSSVCGTADGQDDDEVLSDVPSLDIDLEGVVSDGSTSSKREDSVERAIKEWQVCGSHEDFFISSESSKKGATKFPRAIVPFPSEDIDITVLDFSISAEEIMTFFPAHLSWPKVMCRLLRNGWNERSITAYVNYARNMPEHEAVAVAMTEEVARFSMDIEFGAHYRKQARRGLRFRKKWPRVDDLRPSSWEYAGREGCERDTYISALAEGVVFWPEGIAAGPLTTCIRIAAYEPWFNYTLQQVSDYISMRAWIWLQEMPDGSNHDVDGLRRNRMTLENKIWTSLVVQQA